MKNLLDEQSDSKKNSVDDKLLSSKPKTLTRRGSVTFVNPKTVIG